MDITKIYGIKVFSDAVMSQRLPRDVYESLKLTQRMGTELDSTIAGAVAAAMRDWAVENGATHYSHWFQPMTNITAGKHDAFIMPDNNNNGNVIMEFSSKDLIQSEPDASSFPNGGLRATFEARGYTSWDPTSPAFIRDQTLFIPTAFCSYNGLALDTKTPQLRSMAALNKQGIRLLRALGNTTSRRLAPYCGNEQEYFLVDRQRYEQRLDLKLCGRTLFGAKPAKTQELDDHYCGRIRIRIADFMHEVDRRKLCGRTLFGAKPAKTQELDDHYCGRIRIRIADFMHEVDRRLWELGVPAKSEHNEAAPAQHELASVFDIANVDCDRNQLVMEVLRVVAKEKGLACLLHEKPFRGTNGSGKHHNYSLVTDDGINLLSPGKKPEQNLQFQLMLCAFIKGVDEYADLLRLSSATASNDHRLGGFEAPSSATASNDHRLGGFEAPPAIISIFLGDYLSSLLYKTAHGENMVHGDRSYMRIGAPVLPGVLKDDSDRNRTSPFAFTGNKFEFRMVGSTQSAAVPDAFINTILADVFQQFADRLEEAGPEQRNETVVAIIQETLEQHGRILFNGNNYSQEWEEEAVRRGLPIFKTALDVAPAYLDEKNIALFERQQVFTRPECESRYEILVEGIEKVIGIEAHVMLEMAERQILPAVVKYAGELAASYENMAKLNLYNDELKEQIAALSKDISGIIQANRALEASVKAAEQICCHADKARAMVDEVRTKMDALRAVCDDAETHVDSACWPMPTYTDLMHRV